MFKELRKPEKLKAATLKTQATESSEKLKKFFNDQSFKSMPCNVHARCGIGTITPGNEPTKV